MYICIVVKYPLLSGLMTIEFSWQMFEKYSNVKFRDNLSNGPSCSLQTDRLSDRHVEAKSHFLQFCKLY